MGETGFAKEYHDDPAPGKAPADRGSRDANIERARELKKISDVAGSAHPWYHDWFLKRAKEYLKSAHKD